MNSEFRVSLPVAKKLKKAGFPQDDCDMYWVYNKIKKEWKLTILTACIKEHPESWAYLAAPCVGRLGEELPAQTSDKTWLQTTKSLNGYFGICEKISYVKWEMDKGMGQMVVKSTDLVVSCPVYEPRLGETRKLSEADARGLMWIKVKGVPSGE